MADLPPPVKKELIEWLREFPLFYSTDGTHWYRANKFDPMCEEAADTIERLQAEIAAKDTAVLAEREACATSLEMSNDSLRLMAGEMSAETMRTVQAILKNRAQFNRERDSTQNAN